jgi:trimeric autotransporter adhesin
MNSLVMHQGRIVAAGGNLGAAVEPTVTEFDGTSWSPMGGAFIANNLGDVVAAPGGGVFVSGQFAAIGNVSAPRVAHWDGSAWSSLGAGLDDAVSSMVVTSDGDLIVAGSFTTAGGTPANHVARWNGNNWSTLGAGLPEPALAMAALPSGDVVALLASAPSLQVFDGTSWTALPQPPSQSFVYSPSIVALPNGDLAVNATGSVLRYDGASWSTLAFPFSNLPLRALAVSADGNLLAAGSGVFEWDGSAFQALGAPFQVIHDLLVLPDGDVIAVGDFDFSVNQTVRNGIARWDGVAWNAVSGGTGVSFANRNIVGSVAFTEDGDLVAAGKFASMGGVVTANIARAATNCPAAVSAFGAGCSGSVGPVSLRALDLPWSGATFHSNATGMAPMSLAVQVVGTTPSIGTLPLGAPGCGLFVQPVALDLLLPGSGGAASGSVDASLQIPANAALVGLALRTQVVGIELNAASAITSLTSSNALDLVIGAF